jgi:hypothetical protein
MQPISVRHIVAVLFIVFGMSKVSFAITVGGRPIGIDDFGPAVVIEDYENLGLGTSQRTPRVIGNATYNSDDGFIRVAQFGPALGTSGYAIGLNSTIGWLDIELHQPVHRAGLVFGLDWPWAGSVQFFDTQDNLLGEVFQSVDNRVDRGRFAGWEVDTGGLIARLRVNDTADPGHIIAVDNLHTELIPEPATLTLALAVGGLLFLGRQARIVSVRSN